MVSAHQLPEAAQVLNWAAPGGGGGDGGGGGGGGGDGVGGGWAP